MSKPDIVIPSDLPPQLRQVLMALQRRVHQLEDEKTTLEARVTALRADVSALQKGSR